MQSCGMPPCAQEITPRGNPISPSQEFRFLSRMRNRTRSAKCYTSCRAPGIGSSQTMFSGRSTLSTEPFAQRLCTQLISSECFVRDMLWVGFGATNLTDRPLSVRVGAYMLPESAHFNWPHVPFYSSILCMNCGKYNSPSQELCFAFRGLLLPPAQMCAARHSSPGVGCTHRPPSQQA
jgi:hypothetical protein